MKRKRLAQRNKERELRKQYDLQQQMIAFQKHLNEHRKFIERETHLFMLRQTSLGKLLFEKD